MGVNKKGELFYTVLFLPNDLLGDLPLKEYPRLRVDGEMFDIPFEGALQPAKGRWYLLISRAFMKEHGLGLGDWVEVRFNIGDQDHVDVPEELQRAIEANSKAAKLWKSLTPGKKRGYATQVASAKQATTRETRALKMIEYMLEGKNAGGRSF